MICVRLCQIYIWLRGSISIMGNGYIRDDKNAGLSNIGGSNWVSGAGEVRKHTVLLGWRRVFWDAIQHSLA